jgi:uncharacterized membrane protein
MEILSISCEIHKETHGVLLNMNLHIVSKTHGVFLYNIIIELNMTLIDFKRYEIYDYNTQHMVLIE